MSDWGFIDGSDPYDKDRTHLEIAYQLKRIADAVEKEGEQ